MRATTSKCIAVSILLVSFSSLAHGEPIGLPVADTAEARTAGDTMATVGGFLGDDLEFYGARGACNLWSSLRGFVDIGIVDLNRGDRNFAAQAGAVYSLPDEFISDLGLRAAAYYADTDRYRVWGGSLMLLSSDETLLNNLFLYGGIGVDVSERQVSVTLSASSWRVETNPVVTGGMIYNFTPNIGVFGELTYLDTDVFVGFGLRAR